MQHQRQDGGTGGRRRTGLWASLGAVAAVAIGVGVAIAVSGDEEQPPPEPEVVVLPSPTSTVTPVERPDATAFLAAMPGTDLQYALTAFEPHEGLRAAGAVEAWRLVYSDGAGGEVVVHAGQWRDAEGAAAAMADVLALDAQGGEQPPAEPSPAPTDGAGSPTDAAGSPAPTATDGPQLPITDVVTVDGTQVGDVHIRAGAAGGAAAPGTATAVWTNGTVFFQAEGPLADMPNFYAAFPL